VEDEEKNMNEPRRPPVSPSVVAGIVLIALGILFTLSSFDVIDAGSLGDYWPLFLMVPGFISFVWPRKNADRFWGAILLANGSTSSPSSAAVTACCARKTSAAATSRRSWAASTSTFGTPTSPAIRRGSRCSC
jgi:hypothetical protein